MNSFSSIPLIDLGPFIKGDKKEKLLVSKQIDEACRNIGFLIIQGHSVSPSLINKMYEISEEYFKLPYWEKMRFKMPPDRYRGYTSFGSENLANSLDTVAPPDLKESFSIGPFNHSYDEYHFGQTGSRFFASNFWPDNPLTMRKIWESYFSEMEALSNTLMSAFALALDLDENWFDSKIDKHITNFSVIHYPGQKDISVMPNQLRAGAHSDYGSLTIVNTNTDIGGLEVLNANREWETVPWLPDAFVVNLGDLMAEWTNDRWKSTMHRVINPPIEKAHLSKTSMTFFHQPNYDAVIECIPTCVSQKNPAKYGKTTSGEHVTMKINKHRDV
ncbi:isopenicillin N synthase family oxygenase [Alphaproteobacteria bacterium]|nr:isopenicillin N synthase family oxygenase [Alphaproteobacteria bacterium]